MAKRKGSLLRQLTMGLGLAIVFLSLVSFFCQYQVEKRILLDHIRTDTVRQLAILRTWLSAADAKGEGQKAAQQYVESIGNLQKGKQEIIIVDKDGKIIAATTGQQPGQDFDSDSDMLRSAMAPNAPPAGYSKEVGDEHIVAIPWYTNPAGTRVAGGIMLKQPLTAISQLADSVMLGAFLLLAGTLIITVAVVHLVLRLKVHQPMQAIFMQEYRISEGDLARIEANDPANEFSDLYAMYNEMVMHIADQKRAILKQKEHVALAQVLGHSITRLTGPLDDILNKSKSLLEHEASLSENDKTTLKQIISDVTRIVRELKTIVIEGDNSANWLKLETAKIQEYSSKPSEEINPG